jgi:hypothetical protein
MSGGWSRYTRKQTGGCGEAFIAGLILMSIVGLLVHYL